MAVCPSCGEENAQGIEACVNCNAEIEPLFDPDDWIDVYGGPLKWGGVVAKALQEAGIEVGRPRDEEFPGAVAYVGQDLTASVYVRAAEAERAREVLEGLRKRIPDAFPEGRL